MIETTVREIDNAPLRLRGRFMLADRSEHDCETLAVGVGEIELKARRRGAAGERVIAYLDELGRIEGAVTTVAPGRFRLAPGLTPAKRERLRSKIEWLQLRQDGRAVEQRRHERIEADMKARVEIVAAHGRLEAQVIDYSRSGVALHIDAPLEIGDALLVGGARARVVRRAPGFLAARFDELQRDVIASFRAVAA
jgi:hypothetical protein